MLDCLKSRGPLTSVYLLEQVAMLLANISAVEYTRKQLTQDEAPRCLLHFLQVHFGDEEAVKRLQQKAIVALSRLCGDKSAAQQVVDFDGVQKLVLLCREKKERHDNNAVLVATLVSTGGDRNQFEFVIETKYFNDNLKNFYNVVNKLKYRYTISNCNCTTNKKIKQVILKHLLI